jgi:DNA-binding MarR family transcriptional regulator
MSSRLRREIRQRKPFASLHEEAFLNLQRTANLHFQELGRFLRPYGLTPTQYNALRILRGSHPEALPCTEVGERMVTPVPDVTRLLDRLEARDLVARSRDASDRRVVRASITRAGRRLVSRIDEPLADWLVERLDFLGVRRLTAMIRLMEEARGADKVR